jgi:hypothetical protein
MTESPGKYYTMFLGILVLVTALTISGVAIYYSIAGLVAIFAAAALPIMIMGGALEIGKLVTAVWLHKYWKQCVWWLKTYLTVAVVVLMFITSMGIFGFLSKAHIEQTSAGVQNVAQIERLDTEIARQKSIVDRANEKIKGYETSGTSADTQIQSQIDTEQQRIANAYTRVEPQINTQKDIIANEEAKIETRTKPYLDQIDKIDEDLARLQKYIADGDIKKAQGMVGTRADGAYGSKTAQAFQDYTEAKDAERKELVTQIERIRTAPNDTITNAQAEIKRLNQVVQNEIANSNALINRLRDQLGKDTGADIDALIDTEQAKITKANESIDALTEEKYTLESEYRQLEAEVGPIKYIAEFVYGEAADRDMLEEAVRWVIITIIFVFDPLAVLLLIASQYTFDFNRRFKDDSGERLRREYEQLRAQRIIDNPGYNIDDPKEDADENSREEDSKEESENAEELRDGEPEERVPSETGDNPAMVEEKQGELDVHEPTITADDDLGDSISKDDIAKSYLPNDRMEQSEIQTDEQESEVVEKKDSESSQESERLTEQELDELDANEEWSAAKRQWKQDNPKETIKEFKEYYLQGKIDKLPWEEYLPEGLDVKKKRQYIMKENGQQKKGIAEE